MLINSVIFEMFNYWASIFLFPHAVVENITKLCTNYLWGGYEEFKRIPHISWSSICMPKSQGGIRLQNLLAWNKAIIAKLVWAIASKKDVLWVKWVHGKYLKQQDLWSYTPAQDSSWYWKKICSIKELCNQGCSPGTWAW